MGRSGNARRAVSVIATALTLLLVASCEHLPPIPPGGTPPACDDIAWGSLDRVDTRMTAAPITDVRTGRHECFDRLVVDLADVPPPGWRTGYVEAQTTFGVGVRSRLPYRVFVLEGPGVGSRLVVDVAHRWG
jgi:hypothetical protein